jgi:hypothetical protein
MKPIDQTSEQFGEMKAMLREHSSSLMAINAELKEITRILQANTSSLIEHVEGVKQTRVLIAKSEERTNNRLIPLEKHIITSQAYHRLIMTALSLPAIIYYIIRVFKEFK